MSKLYPGPFSLQVCRFPGQFQEHPRSSGWVINLMSTLAERPPRMLGKVTPYTVSDTPIPMSRNRSVRHALNNGIDYILMIDADVHPDVYVGVEPYAVPFFDAAWDWMMQRRYEEHRWRQAYMEEHGEVDDRDVADVRKIAPATIAAPYCGPPPNEECYILEWMNKQSDHPNPDFFLATMSRDRAAVMSGIQEVAALPTGLILYDARVFQFLNRPWYRYEYLDEEETQKVTTEDVYQTRNASLIGFPQYVLWDAWAGHIKLKTVGKPRVVTPDMVSDCLRNNMTKIRSNQRVRIVDENDDYEPYDNLGRNPSPPPQRLFPTTPTAAPD